MVQLLCLAVPGLDLRRLLGFFEGFAGDHEVTKAMWDDGQPAIPFEIKIDGELMDIMILCRN